MLENGAQKGGKEQSRRRQPRTKPANPQNEAYSEINKYILIYIVEYVGHMCSSF